MKHFTHYRPRVVPHLSSGIVERAKRKRAWKLPHTPFLAWGNFHARSRFAPSTIPEDKWETTRSLTPGGRRRLYCFRVLVCDRVIMTVWRHIATTQSFAPLDQFSVEKPSKLNKERANTGFCSALVKQSVVSVQALWLILFIKAVFVLSARFC